jgi:hypothetical protein
MPTREELMAEAYSRGLLKPEQRAAVEELSRRGLIKLPSTQTQASQPIPDESGGIMETIGSVTDPLMTVGSGLIAEPISGIAGIGGALFPGDPGQGARIVKAVQKALTWVPRSESGKKRLESLGEALKPIADGMEFVTDGAGDLAFDAGESISPDSGLGPALGAATKGVVSILPDLLGMKGTRAAKIARARKLEQSGELPKRYREIVEEVAEDTEDLAEQGLESGAEKMSKISAPTLFKGKQQQKIVEEVAPSAEIIEAAKELGLEDQLLPSHTSGNNVYIAIEQGLKSIPGSQLANREKRLIESLAAEADSLIESYGGSIDKADLSDRFRLQSTELIEGLEDEAANAYKRVEEIIPRSGIVDTSGIIKMVDDDIVELGGEKYLDPQARRLKEDLAAESKPTYARLDKYRKQIGQALSKKSGPFKDSDSGMLKKLYRGLAEDQQNAAASFEVGDLYKTASNLVVTRKGIEKQLQNVLGRELKDSVSVKAKLALLGLEKGDTKRFDALIDSIPNEMGSEIRRDVVVTALNDAFTQASRAEKSLHVPGIDNFMKGIKRNASSYNRLRKEIGPEAMNRLDLLSTVIGGVRKAQKEGISTGRIAAVPRMIDEAEGLAAKIYGSAAKVAAAEGVGVMAGMPGVGTAGVLGAILSAKGLARSKVADELLSNPGLQRVLREKASGKLEGAAKAAEAEERLSKIPEYKAWRESLSDADYQELLAVGFIEFLTKPEEATINE